MLRSKQIFRERQDNCPNCESRLIPKKWEKICKDCGLVVEDNIDFINIDNYDSISQGTPVYAHQSNERQTKPMYTWKRGRFQLLIKKR